MHGEQLGLVIVRGDADGFVQEITAGAHRLRSDEPTSVGGTDTGATPYDLLLAALGSLHVDDHSHVRAPKEMARSSAPPFAFAIPASMLRIVRLARRRMPADGHRP